jgi:capsular polysaccharide biosynthesis protein
MESPLLRVLRRGWRKIALYALVASLVGIGMSFALPLPSGGRLEYSSTMSLLIVEGGPVQADAYSSIKSAERLADSLGQIVYTSSFFDLLKDPAYGIDFSVFNARESTRRRQWGKMVSTQVSRGSGILDVTVYHKDPAQATVIASAVGDVLKKYGADYVGGGDLGVVLVDSPLESRFPVRPNVLANFVTGFVLGGMIGAGLVVVGSRRRSA